MEELAKQDVSVVVSDLMLERPMSATSQDHQAVNPQTQCIVVTSFNDTRA